MVEKAFQLTKAGFAYSKGDITERQLANIYYEIMKQKDGSVVKQIGGRIPMSNATLAEWNKKERVSGMPLKEMSMSDRQLYRTMKESFKQDQSARESLIATKTATFTHNYSNGQPIDKKDPERFGMFLKQIREDIIAEENVKENCN